MGAWRDGAAAVAVCIVAAGVGSRATAQPPSTANRAPHSSSDTTLSAPDTVAVGAVHRVYGRVVRPTGQALAPLAGSG